MFWARIEVVYFLTVRPRHFLKPIIVVVLAAMTTVAVAWGISLQPRAGMAVLPSMVWRPRTKSEGEGWLRAHNMYRFGWRCTLAQAASVNTYPYKGPTALLPEQIIRGRERRLVMPWLDGLRPWPPPYRGDYFQLDDFGWPWHSLYTRAVKSGHNNSEQQHLLDLGSIGWFSRRPLGNLRGLPIGIIWPGFLANTALAALLWGLPIYSLTIWRSRQIVRGRCPHCGYDLRGTPPGSPCPECGRARVAAPSLPMR